MSHFINLLCRFFGHKKGQIVFVKETFVLGKAKNHNGSGLRITLEVSGGVESGLRSTAVIPSAGANCYV